MPETVVRFEDRRPIPAAVFIGNENDNLVESIAFELADWLSEAVVYIYLTANGKSDVVNLGTDRVFDITRTHTHEAGRWEAYLEAYLNGDRVWHSDEFAMYVGALPTIGEQIEQQYPTAIEDALRAVDTLTGVGARAVTLSPGSDATVDFEEDAEGNRVIVYGIPRGQDGSGGGSSAPGTPGEDGGYYVPAVSADGDLSWTPTKPGMAAAPTVNIKGDDGYSPEITTTPIVGGHRLTITDANGTKTINVMDGKDGTGSGGGGADGYSPTIDVSAISGGYRLTITDINGSRYVDIMDGAAGKDGVSATHSWSGTTLTVTSASGTSSANLKGAAGADGKNGVSASHSWSGTTLTVTSAAGSSSADLKGEKGDKGADGRTPVKGTDYYTAADKAEMVNMVLAALPTWTGGSY